MPQPSAQQLHVDRFLTNMAVAWEQDEGNFVAARVFPNIPVLKESDLYVIYDKGYLYRTGQMLPRPLGGRPAQTGFEIQEGNYRCIEYALEHLVDDRERANADQPLDPDISATILLTQQALIKREALWNTQFFVTGVWATDWTGVSSAPTGTQFLQWDQSGADPIQFIRNRINDVAGKTGYRPNKIVFGPTAYEAFLNHPDVVDRLKYTMGPAPYSNQVNQVAASLLDLNEVLVPRGVQNTAAEGQTDAISYIASATNVLLVYANQAPSIRQPSGGYTFSYTGLIPGVTNAFGGVLMRGREELAHSDVFQIRAAYDQRIVASDLGEVFQNVVSANYGISTF